MEYKVATPADTTLLIEIRLEMTKSIYGLPEDYSFSNDTVDAIRWYFLEGNQTTVIAMDNGEFAGCATICYITYLPTYEHPTGIRAHIMNVYTREAYRRQGIASRLVSMIINEAWAKGATEISLDATNEGRPLYRKLGFVESSECMVLVRKPIACSPYIDYLSLPD